MKHEKQDRLLNQMAREAGVPTEDDTAEIIVCQGPPRCRLEGDEAVAAQKAGCPFCKRIAVHGDGSETVREPHEA